MTISQSKKIAGKFLVISL